MGNNMIFRKNNPTDKTIWVIIVGQETAPAFTFDKKTIYYVYRDYYKLSPEEKAIFDKENPYWADYFKN